MKIMPTIPENFYIFKTVTNRFKTHAEQLVMNTERISDNGSEWTEQTVKEFNDHLLLINQRFSSNPMKGGLPVGSPKEIKLELKQFKNLDKFQEILEKCFD